MKRNVLNWIGGILTILSLVGWVSHTSIRIHKVEKASERVSDVERNQRVMMIYLKLQDPELFKKAEELAKE